MASTEITHPFTQGQEALLEQLRKTLHSCSAAGLVFYATSGGNLTAMRRPAEQALLKAFEVEGVPYSVSELVRQAEVIGVPLWERNCIVDAGD